MANYETLANMMQFLSCVMLHCVMRNYFILYISTLYFLNIFFEIYFCKWEIYRSNLWK